MSKKYAVVDVEATTFQKGSPYSGRNRLCLVGIRIDGVNHSFDIEYSGKPYGLALEGIRLLLRDIDVLVGFNLKYDLGWLRRYGLDFRAYDVWDCQLCEFVASNQSTPYPSLDGTCAKYSLSRKSTFISDTYWNNGVDTVDIPWKVLVDYNNVDLEITDALYQYQLASFPESKRVLLKLQNQDLLVLLDMESNGIRFDFRGLEEAAKATREEIVSVEKELAVYTDAWPSFNFDSGDHLSCLLYGGTVSVGVSTPYETTVKSGPHKGTVVTRNRWTTVTKEFQRLVEPIEGSELKKEGYWSVDESTLRQLASKKIKPLVDLLLKRSELEKLVSTYFEGIANIYNKYDWQDGFVHGTFNQCRVVTGRLSSEKPNLQNIPDPINKFIISRFPICQ